MAKALSDSQVGLLDLLARDDYMLTRDPGPDSWTLWFQGGFGSRWEYVERATITARVLFKRELIVHDGAQTAGRKRYILNDSGREALRKRIGNTGSDSLGGES